MPAHRGPTVTKRQRERARDEKRRKKAEKKQQRAAEKVARDARGPDDRSPLEPQEDSDAATGDEGDGGRGQ